MSASKKVIALFPELWKAVYLRHIASGVIGGGHDAFHAARVAQCAYEIAPSPATAKLAGIAGLCHNADRLIQHELKVGRKEVPEEMVIDLINEWLDATDLSEGERTIEINTLLKHSLPNDPHDNLVLKTLKDADRVVNMESDEIMRSAQFYHDCPPVDPVHWLSDPESTFKEPKSVVRDLAHVLEWANFNDPKFGIRLPKARARARKSAADLRKYLKKVENDFKKAGLLPFIPPN